MAAKIRAWLILVLPKMFSKRNIVIILALIVLAGGGLLCINLNQIRNNIFVGGNRVVPLPITTPSSNTPLPSPTPVDNSYNILLLGYGGGNHDGAYLTDSIMLAHIEPKYQEAVIISIPRDVWVKIPISTNEGEYHKINAAYEIGMSDIQYPQKAELFMGKAGGGNLAKYAVEQITGLPIQKFVAIDFDGFTKTIDLLGGVDINVDVAFEDTKYPIEGKEKDLCGHTEAELPELVKIAVKTPEIAFPCRYEKLHFEKGLQHMDGTTALKYVRSRHSPQDGTDFGRSRRQRNLLLAVKQKIISLGFIPKIVPFVSSLQNDLKTDLSMEDINNLVSQADLLSKYQIRSLAITDQNFLVNTFSEDNQAILQSADGQDNWDSLREWLNLSFDPERAKNTPYVKINNCSQGGVESETVVNNLKNKSVHLLPINDKCTKNIKQTTITSYGESVNMEIVDLLKQRLGVEKVTNKAVSDTAFDIQVDIGTNAPNIQ